MTAWQSGDRVRVRRFDPDGLPEFRYGFIEDLITDRSLAVVLLDDDLRPTSVAIGDLAPIGITTVELCLDSTDLCSTIDHDPTERRGLVSMWQAEADQAGLAIERVVPLGPDGAGLHDDLDGWSLAEIHAAGEIHLLRATCQRPDIDVIHLRAVVRHWES